MSKIQKLSQGLFAIVTSKTPKFVGSKPENLVFQGFILDEDDKFLYLSIDKQSVNQVVPKGSIAGIELYSEEDVEIVMMNDIQSLAEVLEQIENLPQGIDQAIEEILPDAAPKKKQKKDQGLH